VEGPHDVQFLSCMSRLYRSFDPTLIDLDSDYRVAFVPTGGGNLKHWVDRQYLRNAGLIEVHIYDADDAQAPPYKPQIDEVNGRGNDDVGFLTVKREMENYIHADAITAAWGGCPAFTDWCDVPTLIAEHIHDASGPAVPWGALTEERRDKKSSRIKKRLNTNVVPTMTLAQLREVDDAGEILGWLRAVRDRVEPPI